MQSQIVKSESDSNYLLAALRLAAHLAFMASESFFLPAAVSPPFFLAGPLAAGAAPPRRWAQRALAAAASFARVAADIGLRLRDFGASLIKTPLRERDLPEPVPVEPPPPKSEDNRCSSELIWFLIERASVSFDRDKSMGS